MAKRKPAHSRTASKSAPVKRQAVVPVLNTPAAVPSNQSATSSEHGNPLSSDRSDNQSAEHPDDDSAAAEAPQVTPNNAGTSTNAEGNKKKAKTETEPVDSTADTPFQQFFLEVGRAREKEFNSATLPTRYGTVSETELDAMLDGPKDSRWTDADEAELMSKWNASQLRKDIEGKKYNSVTYLRRFWKRFLQFMRAPPTDILADFYIQIDQFGKKDAIDRSYSPLWSGNLCNTFEPLLACDLWQGNVSTLAMVLQYAIIVRTDDRRQWPLENHAGEFFIDYLVLEV